jgi:hypothetical protein
MRAFSILVACLVLSMEGLAFAQSAPSPVRTLFVPVTPCRVADTSWDEGQRGGPNLSAGETRQIPVLLSPCGIPADAAAYSMNFLVKPDGVLGYLTAWAAGEDLPLAASLNSSDGRPTSNPAIVPAGLGGDISVFSSDATAAAMDINGYFSPSDPRGLAYYPVPECAVTGQPLRGGETLNIMIADNEVCGIPWNPAAFSLNLSSTTLDNSGSGSLTVWPRGQPRPEPPTTLTTDSTYSSRKDALVQGDYYGDVSIFVTSDTILNVGVNGYFAAPGPGGLSFYPLRPCRVEDTRYRDGFTPQRDLLSLEIDATTKGCGVPDSAEALALSVTIVPAGTQIAYARIPFNSDSNSPFWWFSADDSAIANNAGIVHASKGAFSLRLGGTTHAVIDVTGYFAP